MAAKPVAAQQPEMHLLQFNNLSWGTKLLIPASLLTQLAQLLSLCSTVEEEYTPNGVTILLVGNEVDYGITRATSRHLFVPNENPRMAKDFVQFYKSTYELTPTDDRVENAPVVTWEDFKRNLKEPKE